MDPGGSIIEYIIQAIFKMIILWEIFLNGYCGYARKIHKLLRSRWLRLFNKDIILCSRLEQFSATKSIPVVKISYFHNTIRQILSALSKCSYIFTLVWISSYCSIPGNGKAYSLMSAKVDIVYEDRIAFGAALLGIHEIYQFLKPVDVWA